MKLRLSRALLAGILAALPATAADGSTDLGNVMYVGDSITHGVNSASYRWALHKIFVDNGFTYTEQGVKSGNYSGGVASGTLYGNVAFENMHSSQASARAYEIAGRLDGSKYGRFDYSNLENWLGQSTTKNNGATYTGTTFTGDSTPDTYFLLIGTNDLLSDISSDTIATQLETIQPKLLGDMDTIVDTMKASNPDATITILNIPCWTTHANNNTAASHEAVAAYNTALAEWAAGKEGVTLVDVNKGMIDVASSTPFTGVSSMFNNPGSDGLHPSAQGDLIMAGNVAKVLGYAGRTAGQQRRSSADFSVNFTTAGDTFTLSGTTVAEGSAIDMSADGSTVSCSWGEGDLQGSGFTLDLGLSFGDGAENGWSSSDTLSVTLGTESFYGTLNISEAYIKWGDTVLYSTDMSANKETLRVAWLAGNTLEQVDSGYYVWLGDMLIGEALDVTYDTGSSGLTMTHTGSGNALVTSLALDGTAAWAPTTTGLANGEQAFIASGWDTPPEAGTPQGGITWPESGGFTVEKSGLTVSGTFNARAQADSSTGQSGNSIHTTITAGSTTIIYGNSGNYTGDVWTTISKEGSASSWFAAHGGSGTLTGSAFLRITEDAVGGSTVFGAVNATAVTGNVYVELSAANASFGTFTGTTGKQASLVGSYATNIDGNIDLVVNAGTLGYHVIGGIYSGAKTIGGKTSVFINGGNIGGDVYGGGYAGNIKGGSSVTVTYGNIAGNVYGGGAGDTISAPTLLGAGSSATTIPTTYTSEVHLTGGNIDGDVYGGGKSGTLNGNTRVTVEGSATILHDGTNWGNINGGSESGTVTGDSVVLLKNILTAQGATTFDKYAGTINGGSNVAGNKHLVLDNVQVDTLQATLTGFTHLTATNGTQTSLSSFGGAQTVSIGDNSSLTLNGTSELSTL